MTQLPAFIIARVEFGLRCGVINKASTAAQIFNVIGHRQYVLSALKLIRNA